MSEEDEIATDVAQAEVQDSNTTTLSNTLGTNAVRTAPAPSYDSNMTILDSSYDVNTTRDDITASAPQMFESFIRDNYTPEQQQVLRETIANQLENESGNRLVVSWQGLGENKKDRVRATYQRGVQEGDQDWRLTEFSARNRDQDDAKKLDNTLSYEEGKKKTKVKYKGKAKAAGTHTTAKNKVRLSASEDGRLKGRQTQSTTTTDLSFTGVSYANNAQTLNLQRNQEGEAYVQNVTSSTGLTAGLTGVEAAYNRNGVSGTYNADGDLTGSAATQTTASVGTSGLNVTTAGQQTDYAYDGSTNTTGYNVGLQANLSGIDVNGGYEQTQVDAFNNVQAKKVQAGVSLNTDGSLTAKVDTEKTATDEMGNVHAHTVHAGATVGMSAVGAEVGGSASHAYVDGSSSEVHRTFGATVSSNQMAFKYGNGRKVVDQLGNSDEHDFAMNLGVNQEGVQALYTNTSRAVIDNQVTASGRTYSAKVNGNSFSASSSVTNQDGTNEHSLGATWQIVNQGGDNEYADTDDYDYEDAEPGKKVKGGRFGVTATHKKTNAAGNVETYKHQEHGVEYSTGDDGIALGLKSQSVNGENSTTYGLGLQMQTANTIVGGENTDDEDYSYSSSYSGDNYDYDFDDDDDDDDDDDTDTGDNSVQADEDSYDVAAASESVAGTRGIGGDDDEYEAGGDDDDYTLGSGDNDLSSGDDDDYDIGGDDDYTYSGGSYDYGSGSTSSGNDDSDAPKGHRVSSGKFGFSTTFEKNAAGKVTKRNNRSYGVEYNVGNGSASAGASSTVARADHTTSRSFSVSGDNTVEKKGLGVASTYQQTDEEGGIIKQNDRSYNVGYTNTDEEGLTLGATAITNNGNVRTTRRVQVSGDLGDEASHIGAEQQFLQTDADGNVIRQSDHTYGAALNLGENGGDFTVGSSSVNSETGNTTRSFTASGNIDGQNNSVGIQKKSLKTNTDGESEQHDYSYGAALNLGDNGGTVKVDASTVNTGTGATDFSFTASGNVDGENNAFSVGKKNLRTNADGEEDQHNYSYGAALDLGDNGGTVKVDAATVNTGTGNTDFSFTASGNVDGENNAFSVGKKSLKTNTDGEEDQHDYSYGAALNIGENGGEVNAQSNVTTSEGSRDRRFNVSGTLDGEDSEFALNSSAQAANSDGEVTHNNSTTVTTDYNGAEGASFAYARTNDASSRTVDIGYTNEEDNRQVLYKTGNVVDGARQGGNTVDIALNDQGGNVTLQHDAGNIGHGIDLQVQLEEGDANTSFTTNRSRVDAEGNVVRKASSTEVKKEGQTYTAAYSAINGDHTVGLSTDLSLEDDLPQGGMAVTNTTQGQTEETMHYEIRQAYQYAVSRASDISGVDLRGIADPYITPKAADKGDEEGEGTGDDVTADPTDVVAEEEQVATGTETSATIDDAGKEDIKATMTTDAERAGQIMDAMDADGNAQDNQQQAGKEDIKAQMTTDAQRAGQIMDGMDADGNAQDNQQQAGKDDLKAKMASDAGRAGQTTDAGTPQQDGKDDLKSKMASDAGRAGQTTDAGTQQQSPAPSKEAAQNTGGDAAQQQAQAAMAQKKANTR